MDSESDVVALLEQKGIHQRVIEKLKETSLPNLSDMMAWTPKMIAVALGVPVGLVMPNNFGKPIQQLLFDLNGLSERCCHENGIISPEVTNVTSAEHTGISDVGDVLNTAMVQLSLGPSSFYTALISGKVVDGFLLWPSKLPIFDLTSIMIRDCYITIYDSILQSSRSKTRILVTGVPGIGKSLFALYFAWRYAVDHPEKGFLFEKSVDEIWLCDPRYPFRTLKRSEAYGITDLPYFVDLTEMKHPGEFIGCFGVVFSSPYSDRYKQWVKNPDISERYVMPTWSLAELELVLSNDNNRELDVDSMLQRYEKVGGVPRLVLQGSEDFFYAKLTNALSLKGHIISDQFIVGGLGNKYDDMSYLLVHILPLKHGTDEVQYKTWMDNYEVASPYIWRELCKLQDEQKRICPQRTELF